MRLPFTQTTKRSLLFGTLTPTIALYARAWHANRKVRRQGTHLRRDCSSQFFVPSTKIQVTKTRKQPKFAGDLAGESVFSQE